MPQSSINFAPSSGLVPSDNKPLPQPMLTQIYIIIWHNYQSTLVVTVSSHELLHCNGNSYFLIRIEMLHAPHIKKFENTYNVSPLGDSLSKLCLTWWLLISWCHLLAFSLTPGCVSPVVARVIPATPFHRSPLVITYKSIYWYNYDIIIENARRVSRVAKSLGKYSQETTGGSFHGNSIEI